MKNKISFLTAIISSCVFILFDQSQADEMHSNPPPGGLKNGNKSPQVLQTRSTEKVIGTIKSVDQISIPNQEAQIQLILTTDKGDVLVIMGPASFVDTTKINMQVGDQIMVSGYRVWVNDKEVILAAEIQKNGYAVKLLG